MARVTVEDCIDKVDNRFDLVLLAGHRARMISSGSPITVNRDNDKNPVVALREIADETLSPGDLKEDLIHSLQKHVEVDEPEHEESEDVPAIAENPQCGGFGQGAAAIAGHLRRRVQYRHHTRRRQGIRAQDRQAAGDRVHLP